MTAERQGFTWRRLVRPLLSALVLGLTGFFLWRTLGGEGFRELPQHLLTASPVLLAVAAVINLLRYGVWARRWLGIVSVVSPGAGWWSAFRALLSSVFLNTVLPGARPLGGIVRARILTRGTEAGLRGPVYAATLVDQLGYSLASVATGLLFLPQALVPEEASGRSRVPLIVAGVFGLMVVSLFLHPRLRAAVRRRLGERLSRAAATVEGAVQSVPRLLATRATWLWVIGCGPLVWFLNAVVIWMAGRAMGAGFTLSDAAAAWALGSFVGAASGTPGGIGATEAFGSTVLVAAGVPPSQALAAMLLGRALHYVSAVALGGPFLFLYGRSPVGRGDAGSTRSAHGESGAVG